MTFIGLSLWIDLGVRVGKNHGMYQLGGEILRGLNNLPYSIRLFIDETLY